MYQHFGATDSERQAYFVIFKAWVGNRNVKRWSDSSKEKLNAIVAKY